MKYKHLAPLDPRRRIQVYSVPTNTQRQMAAMPHLGVLAYLRRLARKASGVLR